MDNIILYEYGDERKLYVNLTNACTNKCKFCIRDYSGVGHDLWLEHNPDAEQVIQEFKNKDLSKYDEVIFCGYGEPLLRFDVFKQVADYLRKNTALKIRLNTNGQANFFLKSDITPELEGRLDVISISLNAKDKKQYNELCQPQFGEKIYDEILDFTVKCKKYVPRVVVSVVDTFITDEDIKACEQIAIKLGVEFRARQFSG